MPDQRLTSSFIPKQERSYEPKKKKQIHGSFSTMTLVSLTVFGVVVVAWGGIIGYQWYLNSQIGNLQDQLAEGSDIVQSEEVQDILQADKRFSIVRSLLNQHIAPSYIFSRLEDFTVEDVRYTSFSYEGLPGQQATVVVNGEAHNLSTVLFQSEAFKNSSVFTNTRFTNISKETNQITGENVSFEASMTVPISQLNYSSVYDLSSFTGDFPVQTDSQEERTATSTDTATTSDETESAAETSEAANNTSNQ